MKSTPATRSHRIPRSSGDTLQDSYSCPELNYRDPKTPSRIGPMKGEGNPNATRLARAIEICRQRRAACVLSDPLGYADFETGSVRHRVGTRRLAELDLVTRPKQGGGTRVEVVPDFITSVQFQLIAEQIDEREPPQTYESWWDTVPMWIRHALVEGMSVVVADVDRYFPTVSVLGIERALRRLGLDEESTEIALRLIRETNGAPDANGGTRTGLPVADDELLWLIADVVLRPVDKCLSVDPLVVKHIRWVDDFYVAIDSSDVDRVLITLSEALDTEGFRLNERKTRVLDSLTDFEHQAMSKEHRVVTNLTMVASRGDLSASQQNAFAYLVEGERSLTPEHARLWKRTYALAERIHSPALISDAIDDLGRFPTAERQISSYLRALNWPCGTATAAAKQVARSPTESQAIVLLRALLGASQALETSAVETLREFSESAENRMHPYAAVLLQACLILNQPETVRPIAAQRMLALATDSRSPLARRIAIELLWLLPECRGLLTEAIGRDSSSTVWGLGTLPAIAGIESGRVVSLAEERPVNPAWGPLASKVQRTWMSVET